MEYVDLGLPSGTKWADENEEGYYNYKDAVEKYGYALPTKEQFEELQYQCKWEWVGNGYKVTGPNGNSIVLPAKGYRSCSGILNHVDYCGNYWSSTPYGFDDALYLVFNAIIVEIYDDDRDFGFSVRLVKI